MHFDQILASVFGTAFGFGLLFQAVLPANALAVPAPVTTHVVAAQTAATTTVAEDDPWH